MRSTPLLSLVVAVLATASDAQTIFDLVPGTESSYPSNLTALDGGTLLFTATATPSPGAELWRWTAAGGAELVQQIGVESFPPFGDPSLVEYSQLTPAWLGGRSLVFFSGNDGVHGREPWVTDGTAEGTFMLANLMNASYGSFPNAFTEWKGRMLFAASPSQTTQHIYVTDGTPQGTFPITSKAPYSTLSSSFSVANLGDEFVFPFHDNIHGNELWKSDGTPAGTRVWMDLVPGSKGSYPGELQLFDGKLVFSAYEQDIGRELYVVGLDGKVRRWDLNPGTSASNPGNFVEHGGELFFVAKDAGLGDDLWKLSPGSAAPEFVGDVSQGPSASLLSPTSADDGLYLRAFVPGVGVSLWHTHGVPGDLVEVPFLTPAPGAGSLKLMRRTGGGVLVGGGGFGQGRLFHATKSGIAEELGWSPGVTLDLGGGGDEGHAFLDGKLFVSASSPATGFELAQYDHDRALSTNLGGTASTIRLRTSDPRLGHAMGVTIDGVSPRAVGGALGWSAPVRTSTLLPFAKWNGVVLDPTGTTFVTLLPPSATYALSLPIPGAPALTGLALHLQAGYLQPDFSTFWTSNGVRLDLGD